MLKKSKKITDIENTKLKFGTLKSRGISVRDKVTY